MFMFLPFLLALTCCLSLARPRARVAYAMWIALFVVTIASFFHHATDALHFSF
jgi:hypothetical protein